MIYALGDREPVLAPDSFVAPNATLIGSVMLESRASVWFGVVIRADNDLIRIGAESNVQDNAVIHTDAGIPVDIGRGVTIGHKAMLHGCRLGDSSLIGINAVVLNQATIGRESLIGAGAVVTESACIPDGVLALGSPARIRRDLSADERQWLRSQGQHYAENAQRYRAALREIESA